MRHPIFDAVRYPLDRPDAVALYEALCRRYSSRGEIDLAYRKVSADLPGLPEGGPADQLWKEALDSLCKLGFLRQLCEQLRAGAAFGRNAIALAALTAVFEARAATELTVLPGTGAPGLLMLDRTRLRQHLQRLAPAAAPLKVVIVRGEPKSGKSYSTHLFEAAAREAGAKSVYLADGLVATVEDVLQELFGAYGAEDEIPPRESTDNAEYQVYWRRLRAVAERRGCALWIVVDLGVAEDGTAAMSGAIRELFGQLGLSLSSGVYKDWFRLMLIDYPGAGKPDKWRTEVWAEDRTARADVTVEHVVEHLQTWWTGLGLVVVQEQVERYAAELVAQADGAPPADRLPRLRELVQAATDTGKPAWS